MPRALPMLLLLTACGAAAPAPAPASAPAPAPAPESAPAPASASASAPASAPASAAAPLGPMPTGGAVLIGEIASPPSFDARATLEGMKTALLSCYNQARQSSHS